MSTATLPDDAVSIDAGKVSAAVDQLTAPPVVALEQIPMNLLQASPDNPADRMKGEDLAELAESIKSLGILEPLIVATASAWQAKDDRLPWLEAPQYVVIAGHRRLAAALKAYGNDDKADHFGLTHPVPCIVRDDLVGADADAAMVVENAQRKDLTPIEEAQAYARLRDRHGRSQRQIATLVGRNQSHISKRLDLLKLPEDLQAKAGTDEMSIEDAVAIAKHSDDPKVMKAIANRPSWQSIDDAAQRVISDKEETAAVAEAKRKLKAEGITNIIAMPSYGFSQWGGGPRPLKHMATDGLKTTEHIHSECHAVAVGYSPGTGVIIEPVCTKPASHPESREAKDKADRAKTDQAREKANRATAKRKAARSEVIKSALAKIDAATDQCVRAILLEWSLDGQSTELYDYVEEIAAVLDVDIQPPVELDQEQLADFDSYDIVVAAIEKLKTTAAGTSRTLAALTLCVANHEAESNWGSSRTARKVFLEWLQARGYKLTGDEATRLKEASA